MISDCGTSSRREEYLDDVVKSLPHSYQVERYGKCGDGKHSFPKEPSFWSNPAFVDLLGSYKFYFALENTIRPGYTSEKLFSFLAMGVVPVYYGDAASPRITHKDHPCYIHAHDFHNASHLASHLVFLDQHPLEYAKYHEWRRHPEFFDPAYLHWVAKSVPGPKELALYPMDDVKSE